MADKLDHLLIQGFTSELAFKSTLSVRKGPVPPRNRDQHARHLLTQLVALGASQQELDQRRRDMDLTDVSGTTIAIEISPKGAIDYRQFEWRREGIEVLNVIEQEAVDVVVIFVPDGKLSALENRIRDYQTKNTLAGKPANASLVNAISHIRRAVFANFWTDDRRRLPPDDHTDWFQIWLRPGGTEPKAARDRFALLARRFNIEVEPGFVAFPGRIVVAAHGSRAALEAASELLDDVAEIRSVAVSAKFFLSDLQPYEQSAWATSLTQRTQFPPADAAPYVALLDTGVNRGHPLLEASIDATDTHAVKAEWRNTDHDGHGTEMAGLVLYGDLKVSLASAEPIMVPHRMESVKILPPNDANPPHLYGWVTRTAAELVESKHPERRRQFAMMTTCDGQISGLPSEWSATLDQLASGTGGNPVTATTENGLDESDAKHGRLIIVSAGNVPWDQWANYPVVNDTSSIQDPAQSWNAVVVGAYTDHAVLDSAENNASLSLLAKKGALAPSSTTSLLWTRTWPFKPDVVAEGGNGSKDSGNNITVGPECVRLLSTSHDMTSGLFVDSGDTSAATAEVSRIAAHLQAKYPEYWAETIRALVVHGARYTPAMRSMLPLQPRKQDKENLLRRFGYGAVSLEQSAFSSDREPTLVVQDTLHPYDRDGADVKLGHMRLHTLPWPIGELQALGDTRVELRITLSYFVEPNPSRRGWQSKFRYQSHGLRFAVKGSTENDERFLQRINKLERDDEVKESISDPDALDCFLGAQLRARGSLHSDLWAGTAAKLAQKSHIAVFPVGGWWKDWKALARDQQLVRYSLVLTLSVVDDVDIDLYTPIANQIRITVPIDTTST